MSVLLITQIFAVIRKVGIPLTGLTTPVMWLLLFQLSVLSRSGFVCVIEVFVAFLCYLFDFWNFPLV